MPTFDITIGAKVPAYGTVHIEADSKEAAQEIAARIARQGWNAPELPIGDFAPEWDAMGDFEVAGVDEHEATCET